jgi:hypothetical protein
MVTIQARELEALQARIREAEERLKQRESRVKSPTRHNDHTNHNDDTHRSADLEGRGENEKAAQSPLSSALSDGHPSDEGFTDSSTSAATSNDFDEEEEEEDEGKEKTRES